MFGIIKSAFFTALGFVFRTVAIKFIVFGALFVVVAGFVEVLKASGLLPTAAGLNSAFMGLPAGVWWWLDLFNFSTGFQLLLAASVARFLIRRIPVIG